ncbi:tubulin/FtsZ family protein [Halonotius pteroides]|uniref:Tubulin-like protein CetZ n=1 Tax=Halonotius pteroides TaxID=268735 RepID=A0A3A6PYX7_9EURY|nr:tubulin/FtsZ family protein [Halonotius pteroides]RJX49365.1 cell division protein [Halonotius pteroides]
MQLTVCGVGGAGCRIADHLVAADSSRSRSFVADSVALDTDQRALSNLESIPDDRRHLYGVIEAEGTGVEGDRSVGAAAADSEATELANAVDDAVSSQADAILCCVGLAGGSGATALPRLADELRRVYDIPVYGLGVLPAIGATSDDGSTPPAARNTGRALANVTATTDALLLFDNQLWLSSGDSETDPEVRTDLNKTLTTRVAALFAAGEGDHDRQIAERVVDASEVQNTFGAGGIATIGYASQTIERPTSSRFGLGILEQEDEIDDTTAIKAIETTSRRAVRGKLTVEIDRESVERGLLIVGGPPGWLNRRAVSDARSWLAQETGSVEIRGGDMPDPDGDAVTMIALLTGVGSCPRVRALRAAADRG